MRRTHRERPTGAPRRTRRPWRAFRRHVAAAPTLALVLLGAVAPSARPQAPGPESFASEPKTPMELWEAADYLARVGRADQAAPYLKKFLDGNPDDETLIQIRDRTGAGPILKLEEYPATRALARTLLGRLSAAARRRATDPERLKAAIAALTATPAEQAFAVDRLKEAGPYAVPALVSALASGGRSPEDRALIAANAGRLDPTTVPAWIAVLDAPAPDLAADAAGILGRLGDARAVPALTALAARPDAAAPARDAARRALERITGRPFRAQPRPPARVLADEARKYLTHAVPFPANAVELWEWSGDAPAPKTISAREAETALGLRFAGQALRLDPADAEARATLAALRLREGQDLEGDGGLPRGSGSASLVKVLRRAIADGQPDVAAAAVTALGKVVGRDSLTAAGARPSPLVEALAAPDRRVQYAAAKALVDLDPVRPFPGSDRVVPALARFVADNPTAPRVVVIDGNLNRGNRVASLLHQFGYDGDAVASGEDGFRQAAETADVEAVFLEPSGLQGAWRTADTVANLRADARTAGLPIFLLQPDDPSFEQRLVDRGFATPFVEHEPNDIPDRATPVAVPPDTHRARIAGLLPASDIRGDFYRLGPLRPGATVVLNLVVPRSSTLDPKQPILTLEREVIPARGDARSFPVATASAGRLTYLVPPAPEPEPRDLQAVQKEQVEKSRKEDLIRETPRPDAYGGYLIRVRHTPPQARVGASITSQGPFPQYLLDLSVIDRVAPVPGPSDVRERLEGLASRYPRVALVVPSTDPTLWRRQLESAMGRMGTRPLSEAERSAYAQGAATALARAAARPDGPFAPDLERAAPALIAALTSPAAGPAAATALAGVPGVAGQRALADVAGDPGRPVALRLPAAEALARSLRRFGRLLAADQESRLVAARDQESDPALKDALTSAVVALLPRAPAAARRPPADRPSPAAGARPSS